MNERFDIAVVGSGFSGSLFAMIVQRLGMRVILLERGRHPRTVIGESSTPLSNLLLEELSMRYGLVNLRPLCKWGAWRESHPELACGLKRGFSFFHHVLGRAGVIEREDQLLVAASPNDQIADTHWFRADFDAYLANEAQRLGVAYLDEVDLTAFADEGHEVSLRGMRAGHELKIAARFIVDATGPRGFLHRALSLDECELPGMSATSALYCHFSGVRRLADISAVALSQLPPYPIDDAAVHHVFDGGWVWVLHFSNGVTSAGIAATDALAKRFRLVEGNAAWERILKDIPLLKEQFRDAQPVQPFRHISHLGFRSAKIAGKNWALLPSAAGFVDPILSTGFPLTLLGIARLVEILERDWQMERFDIALKEYAQKTDAELLATSRLISALYTNFGNFPVFSAISLLYFAAASYTEAVRRLGRSQLTSSFLLYDHSSFGEECARVLEQAHSVSDQSTTRAMIEEIRRVIEPVDVAGLSDFTRRNWYPVDAEDLLRAAHKLHASRGEIVQMLDRCGFNTFTICPS